MKVKVRIAPSPTGNLHIGTARTALFNWLYAKKTGGEFILRIEDTDLERSDQKYENDIVESLKWLGLDWNGQIYRQSERLDVYEKYILQLLGSGKAFWCRHTKDELESESKKQMANKEAPRHVCNDKYKRQESRDKSQENGIIRLNVNENSKRIIHFNDEIRGVIEWEERLIGDLSLAKDERTPLYNFAVVVDDVEMKISHVIRGEDHISNTPKQLLIYEALSVKSPVFAHISLTLGSDKSKLSKRHGAVSIMEYKKDYLPEALVNFMGFLGYTYSKEIISKEEMAEEFNLKKAHKSAAVFNIDKLNWLNAQYIKQLDNKAIKQFMNPLNIPDKAIPLIVERLEKLSDIYNFDYFWKQPDYDGELLKWKKSTLKKSAETLAKVKKILEEFDFEQGKDELRKILDEFSEKAGGDRGLVYWPLRVALTGREKSPDPVEVVFVLMREEVMKRIDTAIKKLSS